MQGRIRSEGRHAFVPLVTGRAFEPEHAGCPIAGTNALTCSAQRLKYPSDKRRALGLGLYSQIEIEAEVPLVLCYEAA